MNRASDLVIQLALGLTLRYFAERPTIGDIHMLVHGRPHLWPGWDQDKGAIKDQVARFLAVRPNHLVDDRSLLDGVRAILREASEFQAVPSQDEGEPDWGTAYELVRGRPLDERIREWFFAMDEARAKASASCHAKTTEDEALILIGDGVTYRVPWTHLTAEQAPTPLLRTTRAAAEQPLKLDALTALARAIDQRTAATPGLYEQIAIGRFLHGFTAADGRPPTCLSAGVTKLAIAPTGTGKSVFTRLFVLDLARRGLPTALVVPDIPTVWKETRRLRDAAQAAGLDLSIVPVSSWRDLASHLESYLARLSEDDAEVGWILDEVGYVCLLAAYAEDDAFPKPGQEPCTRLSQRSKGDKDDKRERERRVACPFAIECGRFSAFRRAVAAQIIVVNHHAFLSGRIPIEIVADEGVPRRISTTELVLRRSAVVIVDEIDVLQKVAINTNSRGLSLSSGSRLSKLYQLLVGGEQWRIEQRRPPDISFERTRSALLRIIHVAENLPEWLNRKELSWPSQERMTWRGANDVWLAQQLFGGVEDDCLERLVGLYADDPLSDDECAEGLRRALRPLGSGLGDGTLMLDVRTCVMQALQHCRPHLGRETKTQKVQADIADRLIRRAVLMQLDRALAHLRPQLATLEEMDVREAIELRNDLLSQAPWQPSPIGALGRRLSGYVFTERSGELGVLKSQLLSGDPHGLIRELGGIVAHALTGTPRLVIGFSATCRFRGAPYADVLGEVVGWVRDEVGKIRIRGAPVKARISGVGRQAERLKAVREGTAELWASQLSHYLQRLIANPETCGRARALLVTGSYAEAGAVAEELRRVAGSELMVRYLVRDGDADPSKPEALERSQIESFGDLAGPAILVGPLSVVARGHNILQPGTPHSALSGIFVLTRPVPSSHEADRFLAHIAYNARLDPPSWQGSPGATLKLERGEAWRRLRILQRSSAMFRRMDPELRRELVCDVLVDLAQVAGRARRGGTSVDLFFVDGAFQDDVVPWPRLVEEILIWWRERGWLREMLELHGAFVAGLAEYAGFDLSRVEQEF